MLFLISLIQKWRKHFKFESGFQFETQDVINPPIDA